MAFTLCFLNEALSPDQCPLLSAEGIELSAILG
jgi:hypothetical protein